MIVIYLRDGRTIELREAQSVVHRSQVLFLDQEGDILQELATEDILAYSHSPYDLSLELTDKPRRAAEIVPTDFNALGRRRHRRPPETHSATA